MKSKPAEVELIELFEDPHDYAFVDAWVYAYKILINELMQTICCVKTDLCVK